MAVGIVTADLLPQRATLERASKAADGFGQWAETWETVNAALPCRCGQAGSYGSSVADQIDAAPARPVWCEPTADVRKDDRLTVPGIGALRVMWTEPQADGAYLKLFCVPDKAA